MASIQPTRRIYKKARPAARQPRRKEKQNKERTAPFCSDGFLRQSFVPVTTYSLPCVKEIKLIERDFFDSLTNLTALYNFSPPDVSGKVFPLNIHLAYQHAVDAIEENNKDLHLLIISDETHCATLATAKVLESGLTLFYVPAEPLFRMIKSKQNRQVAELLLSAFSYLHLIAGMPFCDASFIGGTYDMLHEWITESPEEWDKEDYKEKKADMRSMFRGIKQLKKLIIKPTNLTRFKQRLERFCVNNEKEQSLLTAVQKLYDLWQSRPDKTFDDSIHYNLLYTDKEERIMPDEYFSFYWHAAGWLYEDLMENVNVSLQEKEMSEDPMAIQFFDTPQSEPVHDLAYATQLLDIIWELADVLNDY